METGKHNSSTIKLKNIVLDIKKTSPDPVDQWEAIGLMVNAQSGLLQAIHIMDSSIGDYDLELRKIHDRIMIEFIKQFEK